MKKFLILFLFLASLAFAQSETDTTYTSKHTGSVIDSLLDLSATYDDSISALRSAINNVPQDTTHYSIFDWIVQPANPNIGLDDANNKIILTGDSVGVRGNLDVDGNLTTQTATISNAELSYLDGVTSAIQTQLNARANNTLNNLGSTAINANLLPSLTNTRTLGNNTYQWDAFYGVRWYYWDGTRLNELRWSAVTEPRVINLPDKNGTIILAEDTVLTLATQYDLTQVSNAGISDGDKGDVSISSGVWSVEDDSHNHIIDNTDSLRSILNSKISGNQTITISGDGSGSGTTAITLAVADDSHNHIISNVDALQDTLNKKLNKGDSTLYATQYDLTQVTPSGDTLSYTAAEVDSLLGLAGSALQANQTITLSGDVSGSGTTAITATVADDSHNHIISNVDGLQDTIDQLQADINSISGTLTAAQETELNMLWAYHAPLDTTATDPNIADSADAVVSTLISSDSTALASLDVGRFYNVTSSEFRLYNSGWSAWYNNAASNPVFSKATAIQVRDTSSASNSTATNHRFYVAGVVDTFTITTEAAGGGGGSHITDSLKLFWNFDSISTGTVAEWFDDIANYRATPFGGDTSNSPLKSGTDVVYDGNDYLRGTTGGGTIPNFTGSPMTVYGIVDLQDTTSTALLFGAARTRELTVSIAGNRICALGFNGTTSYWANAYSTPFLGKHVITATFDGSSAPKIYLDGTLTADVGDVNGSVIADNRAFMGGDGTNNSPAGTSIPLFMVYNVEHNSTQVNTNVDSNTFQDLIP